jgi:hypothetical protein
MPQSYQVNSLAAGSCAPGFTFSNTVVNSVTDFVAVKAAAIASSSTELISGLLGGIDESGIENTVAAAVEQPMNFTLLKYVAAVTTLALMIFCIVKKDFLKEKSNEFIVALPHRLYGKKIPVKEVDEDAEEKLLNNYHPL